VSPLLVFRPGRRRRRSQPGGRPRTRYCRSGPTRLCQRSSCIRRRSRVLRPSGPTPRAPFTGQHLGHPRRPPASPGGCRHLHHSVSPGRIRLAPRGYGDLSLGNVTRLVRDRCPSVFEYVDELAGRSRNDEWTPVDNRRDVRCSIIRLTVTVISLRALGGVTLRSVAPRDSGRGRTHPRIADPVYLRCHHLPISPVSNCLKTISSIRARISSMSWVWFTGPRLRIAAQSARSILQTYERNANGRYLVIVGDALGER